MNNEGIYIKVYFEKGLAVVNHQLSKSIELEGLYEVALVKISFFNMA